MRHAEPNSCSNLLILFSLEVFVCPEKYNGHYEWVTKAYNGPNYKLFLKNCYVYFYGIVQIFGYCSAEHMVLFHPRPKTIFNEIVSKYVFIWKSLNESSLECVWVWVTTLPPFQMYIDRFRSISIQTNFRAHIHCISKMHRTWVMTFAVDCMTVLPTDNKGSLIFMTA